MADNTIFLLRNATSDGSGVPIACDGSNKTLYIKGDFGGGTITLEASNDTSDTNSWAPLTYGGNIASYTTNTVRTINLLKAGLSIRATMTGAANCNITVAIY